MARVLDFSNSPLLHPRVREVAISPFSFQLVVCSACVPACTRAHSQLTRSSSQSADSLEHTELEREQRRSGSAKRLREAPSLASSRERNVEVDNVDSSGSSVDNVEVGDVGLGDPSADSTEAGIAELLRAAAMSSTGGGGPSRTWRRATRLPPLLSASGVGANVASGADSADPPSPTAAFGFSALGEATRAKAARGVRVAEQAVADVSGAAKQLRDCPPLMSGRAPVVVDHDPTIADDSDGDGYASDASGSVTSAFSVGSDADSEADEAAAADADDDAWLDLFESFAGVVTGGGPFGEFADISSWADDLAHAQVERSPGASDYDFLRARMQSLSPTEPLTDEFLDAALEGRRHLLDRLLAVPISAARDMLPPHLRHQPAVPVADLRASPLPTTNVPRRERAPQSPPPLPTLPDTYPVREVVEHKFIDSTLPALEAKLSARMLEARRRGAKAKLPPMEHHVFSIDEVLQRWARPFFWDMRDTRSCRTMSHVDTRRPTALRLDYADVALRKYPTQSTLHGWRFGFDLRVRDMPRQLALCRPLLSASPHMEFLDGTFADECAVREGGAWATDAVGFPPFVPGQFEACGVAIKKHSNPPKLRRTTDKSGPKGFAVNEFIDLLESFSRLQFVTPQQHATAAAVLSVLARAAGLPALGFADDFKAWFNQFAAAERDAHRNGYVWVDAAGVVHYPWSDRIQFGGKPGPNFGQDSMDAVLWRVRLRFRAQAVAMEQAGQLPGLGLDAVSQAFQAWRRLRQPLGEGNPIATESAPLGHFEDGANVVDAGDSHGQLVGAWDAGYIDDALALAVGLLRLILWALCYWEECDLFGIATAPAKAQFGSTIKHLGLVAIYDLGYLALPEDKLSRLLTWCERLIALHKVKGKEIESFAGTVQFCSIVRRDVRRGLIRFYRALSATFSHRYAKHGHIRISKGMKHDLRSIADKFLQNGGVSVFPSDDWLLPGTPDHGAWQTDSCRNQHNLEEWSGMGGFFAGSYWWIKLTPEETEMLPVHITEAVANLCNLECFGSSVAGGKIVEELDSAPFYDALQARKAKDPLLQEVLTLREAVEGRYNILTRPRWIASDDNTLSDLLSRGRFREFEEAASELGWPHPTRIKPPRKIKALLSLLIRMKREILAVRRKRG